MKKQVEIKWNEDEDGKEYIKFYVDNKFVASQTGLSAIAIAEVLSKFDCDVYISSKNNKGETWRHKFKSGFPG